MEICQRSRVIFKANGNGNDMQRIVVLKETKEQELQKWDAVWGNYFQEEFMEDVILEAGQYLLLSLNHGPIKELEILFQDSSLVTFQTAEEPPYRTR
jgi:hypothetical protein